MQICIGSHALPEEQGKVPWPAITCLNSLGFQPHMEGELVLGWSVRVPKN